MRQSVPGSHVGASLILVTLACVAAAAGLRPFPAVMPKEKPAGRPLSASWARMWDQWNPREDHGNELFSNFKYTPLQGLSREPNVSRRDPSKVLRIDDSPRVRSGNTVFGGSGWLGISCSLAFSS
jgi:hypothetical protein